MHPLGQEIDEHPAFVGMSALIAHRDPGVANWLDTEGRPFGLVFWRFMLTDGPVDTPIAEVVPVDALAG